MIQKFFQNVSLNCVLQEKELTTYSCPQGVLTLTPTGGLQFTENPPSTPHTRNPKVVKGSIITLVQKEGIQNYILGIKNHNPAHVDIPFPVMDMLVKEYLRTWMYSHGIFEDDATHFDKLWKDWLSTHNRP